MNNAVLMIIDCKGLEEALAAQYWAAPRRDQIKLLRLAGARLRPQWVAGATPEQIRQEISTVLAGLPDVQFGALAQSVIMNNRSA